MATLDTLKRALRQKAILFSKQSLSDTEYSAGFDILTQNSVYQDFIIPQLSQLLSSLFHSRLNVSVLEIGPGPRSILGSLPTCLKRKIKRYTAFEPNSLFASKLEEWCRSGRETESPFNCLESPADIHRCPFVFGTTTKGESDTGTNDDDDDDGKFDVILFCHSMYGMKPKRLFIERALELLVKRPEGGMVVVFHRDGTMHFDNLVCHRTASFPTGIVRIPNEDEVLDRFAPFIAGFILQDSEMYEAVRIEWRKVCRALAGSRGAHSDHLLFSSPNIMVAFNQHATKLPELIAQVPLSESDRAIKNSQARFRLPVPIVRPTEVRHVQQCVRWALKNDLSLTVLGGGHSGQCLWPNIVSVNMDAFDRIHVLKGSEDEGKPDPNIGPLVVAEAGCKTGEIVHKTTAEGLAVPLGARPSVGAGLWLQGGIGHLVRQHGLACDAIVGAVLVSVDSGQVFYVGRVPIQYRPTDAVRPKHENDLLWAMKGAGTNFGIVISVTFKAYAASTYVTRDWIVPLSDCLETRRKLGDLDGLVARKLPVDSSVGVYLFWSTGRLHLGVTLYESFHTGLIFEAPTVTTAGVRAVLGLETGSSVVDGVGLFGTEMYMSGMHGGHGGGKTSSFKRCLFLRSIGEAGAVDVLVAAIETRPSPLCYLHLLQGGGAIANTAADATAFGCRDWEFACVVTGVWTRDQDGTDAARIATEWVYEVVRDLLPFSSGVYGADLGPDPRDAALAARAFGLNRSRLARLKYRSDPHNLLACACPLPKISREPKLIVLVTGESCAGKDYCAGVWATTFTRKRHTARVVSISDVIKREYAAVTGVDADRLFRDRAFKEKHRPELTAFYRQQVRQRPWLPEEQFLHVVYGAPDTDVLLITGMRDEAPVAALSHLVPNSRLLELRVSASDETRQTRRGCCGGVVVVVDDDDGDRKRNPEYNDNGSRSNTTAVDYRPNLTFNNNATGNEAAEKFAENDLLPFLQEDLQRLADMVRSMPDFPRLGVEFRHVLGIAQRSGGLSLCTSLLQTRFAGDWSNVDVVACCESGGFVYGSALATQVKVPLALIREAGKLPPPTVSVPKLPSHVSSLVPGPSGEKRIEMNRDAVQKDMSVVVVDDVLATGETLSAMLQLLKEAGTRPKNISVMVVAEFPVHRGRELLRQCGFGEVNVQSLLIFDCA